MSKMKVLCPFCRNGKTGDNEDKYRAWILGLDNHPKGTGFKCFRCGKKGHATLYYNEIGEEWTDLDFLSTFEDKMINFEVLNKKSEVKVELSDIPVDIFSKDDQEIIDLYTDDENFEIIKFMKSRGIPDSNRKYFGYSFDFLSMHKIINEKEIKFNYRDRRITIKYLNKKGDLYALKARSIDPNSPIRYLTLRNENEMYFKEFDINYNNVFYILEGEIDSMFIKNSVAIGTISKCWSFIERYPNVPKKNFRFVLDNDEAGSEANVDLVNDSYHVFNWSTYLRSIGLEDRVDIKDINDLVDEIGEIDYDEFNKHFISDPLDLISLDNHFFNF